MRFHLQGLAELDWLNHGLAHWIGWLIGLTGLDWLAGFDWRAGLNWPTRGGVLLYRNALQLMHYAQIKRL